MTHRQDLEQALFRVLYDNGVSFESNKIIPLLADAVEGLPTAYDPPESLTLPLDPEPWEEDGVRSKHHVGAYLPVGQLGTEFLPREGYEQSPYPYLRQLSRLAWKKDKNA